MMSSILLLGEYNVGKTHFGGQLLGRLNREDGALRMVGQPESIEAFDGVLQSLNDGRAAAHTPAQQYVESRWPIADAGGNGVDLVWPDYGGEQISAIRSERRMPPEWRKRVETSDGWIVMVRIHNAHVSDDIFTRPLTGGPIGNGEKPNFKLSDQARLTDFLQWLLFIRGTGSMRPVASPKLMLLLSCWDELPLTQISSTPRDVLRLRLPMVAAFVKANWAPEALHVLGLSALERSLSEDEQDEEYIERGPESFGYLVTADGTHVPDLTLAIAPLI